MNRTAIVDMAYKATKNESSRLLGCGIDDLQRFAELVAATEREACAVIAETPFSGEQDDITMEAKDRVAAAIRKRSNVS